MTGGRGSAGSREPKRKAKSERSELSTPQAAEWRQLTLSFKFGGMGGEGKEGGGKAERKGRGRAEGRHDVGRSSNPVWNTERQPLQGQIAVMAKDLHQA